MTNEPLIQFKNIVKRFPGVTAVKNVSISIEKGTCHALMGENGAGKSTLGKILAGIYESDEGEILIKNKHVKFKSPLDAIESGIGMVHQELSFCENMTVAENLCLGQMPVRGGFLAKKKMHEIAKQRLGVINANIDTNKIMAALPVGVQQIVQIASAVGKGADILIFDEPTSSLSEIESRNLFALIKMLKQKGVTSIYVSHRLDEIFELCDNISVMRDGELVNTVPISQVNNDSLIEMMIGRKVESLFTPVDALKPGEEKLRVENLSSPNKFKKVSFSIKRGEILGFAGLVGSGRTEIAEAIFGLDKSVSGNVFVDGKPIKIKAPGIAMNKGFGLIPEDRKRHGLVLGMGAKENITLPSLNRISKLGFIKFKKEREISKKYYEAMKVKATSINDMVATLSGGNQQKIVIAKWLASNCNILLIDEPTRGVDIGAKADIHHLIYKLASEGAAIMLVSSDLPEVLHISTRIAVMRDGELVGIVDAKEATQQSILKMMAGY